MLGELEVVGRDGLYWYGQKRISCDISPQKLSSVEEVGHDNGVAGVLGVLVGDDHRVVDGETKDVRGHHDLQGYPSVSFSFGVGVEQAVPFPSSSPVPHTR